MKYTKYITGILLCIMSTSVFCQNWTYPSSNTASFQGAVGIGTTSPQNTFEVVGSGQFIRNPANTSYSTFRLYNDQNNLFRTLEIDYSGSQYSGPLVNEGPLGESGSITTTGLYPLTLGTNNTRRFLISPLGNVGIGMNNPAARLHVDGTVGIGKFSTEDHAGLRIQYTEADGIGTTTFLHQRWGGNVHFTRNGAGGERSQVFFGGSSTHFLNIYGAENDVKVQLNSAGNSYFVGGNVGIGTDAPDAKLAVKGHIHTQEVRVDLTGAVAPDYVFEPTYHLLPLSEVESYIKANKHLPEVPSAKEMEEEGLNLKEMNLLLLKKVEELTLHLIEMKKDNAKLKDAERRLESLENRLKELESTSTKLK